MPTPSDWLPRLEQTTDYRELQVLFTEIAAEARTTDDPAGLASRIDEAVLRIERERHRDEDELRAFEAEYEAFKEKESGVVGWLKRHAPFTATRREAKEHKATLADQEAEILADNLVIARAQMLKEGLLPPRDRRLGNEPALWRQLLSRLDAVEHLTDYAAAWKELGRELAQSREFVKQVDADVDAFARARFASDEDRRRQKDDVTEARGELAVCEAEIEDEQTLHAQGTDRLRELVTAELVERDPSFRRLADRARLLESAASRAEQLEEGLGTLETELSAVRDLAERIESLPARRDELARTVTKLGREADDTERTRLAASATLAEHAVRLRESEARVSQAEADVDAAQRALEAFIVETGQVELPEGTTAETSSPQAAAHARAVRTLEQVRADHRVTSAAHAAVEAETQVAASATAAVRDALSKAREEDDELGRDERRLADELEEGLGSLQPRLDSLPRELTNYRGALRSLEQTYERRDLDGELLPRRRFTVEGMGPRSHRELSEALERCRGVLETVRQERTSVLEDLESDRSARDAALAARCRELLGDELGALVG